MKTIVKSRSISAPKENVWMVLLEDEYNRAWYAEFAPGTYADTDWIIGHQVRFMNECGGGMIATVAEKRPYDLLDLVYDGMITPDGGDDLDSVEAQRWKGGRETYRLEQSGDNTQLTISADVPDEAYELMEASWESALNRISELALAVKPNQL